MKKVFQKILLLVTVITVVGHSVFPHFHLNDIKATVKKHHHHDKQTASNHHHDDKDSKSYPQSIFSFAQLDEDFIPANGQSKNFDLPVEYLPALIVTYLSYCYPVTTKTQFGWYREFPPPGAFLYNLPSRAPPAVI